MIRIFLALFILTHFSAPGQVKSFDNIVGYKNLPDVDTGKIRVIDSRSDKKNLGIVQVGMNNRRAPVLNEAPLSDIMQKLIGSKIQHELTRESIVINIRVFNFAETTKTLREFGYARFRAELYQPNDGYYTEISTIDTLITVNSIDVTNKIIKESLIAIENWLKTSINAAIDTAKRFSLEAIKNRDKIEKRKMPFYSGKPLINGIYRTYDELVNVNPSQKNVEIIYDSATKIMMANVSHNMKTQKLTKKDGYAVVFNNALFILTQEGVSEAYPKDGFIYFKAKYNREYNISTMAPASFGLLGAMVVSGIDPIDNSPITFRVDHLTGAWLPVSER
jgi:hypothetical protein